MHKMNRYIDLSHSRHHQKYVRKQLDGVYKHFWMSSESSINDINHLIYRHPPKADAKETLILLSKNFARFMWVSAGTWSLPTWVLLRSDKESDTTSIEKLLDEWNDYLNERIQVVKVLQDASEQPDCTKCMRIVDDMGLGIYEVFRLELKRTYQITWITTHPLGVT